HRRLLREEIPPLFDLEFNPSLWNSGHVRPKGRNEQILFVTLNKQGKVPSHQYIDRFEGPTTFHWQSQAKTTVASAKGQAIVNHTRDRSPVHLFVRAYKLEGGKSAPFYYCGRVTYESHSGEAPINVVFRLDDPAPSDLLA
ncbi:MAG TPA: DUF3427 domain-containing protein, partial [Chromatiales bacterium]|nr:DUF3427 domain-containing protein [Chromatiales bacterium]